MRDAIDMAREAGCIPVRHPEYDNDVQVFATPDVLKAFEALVRADEREACADVVESTPWSDWFRTDCAAAIRTRGKHEL